MNSTEKYVIDSLITAGIKTVKVDSPVIAIDIINDTVTVAMVSIPAETVDAGIQFIIDVNPLVVFIKDVIVDADGCRFRLQFITM